MSRFSIECLSLMGCYHHLRNLGFVRQEVCSIYPFGLKFVSIAPSDAGDSHPVPALQQQFPWLPSTAVS